jgi:hypothetical protein
MKQNQITLRAKNGYYGLDVYLLDGSGNQRHITTRRPNGMLWSKLKDGVTLHELRRYKPRHTRFDQQYYHSTGRRNAPNQTIKKEEVLKVERS